MVLFIVFVLDELTVVAPAQLWEPSEKGSAGMQEYQQPHEVAKLREAVGDIPRKRAPDHDARHMEEHDPKANFADQTLITSHEDAGQ